MKKLLSFLTLLALIALASCSKENRVVADGVAVETAQQKFTVQGHPYEVSKSKVKDNQNFFRSATTPLSGGDPNFSMDDIRFWVGTGTNKAAMVIQWHDGKTPDALVWGYKWNGTAYGFDMIREIVKADPRLIFLTHITGPMGNTIAGLGYDINQIGDHYLIYNRDQTVPHYPIDGIVTTDT